MTDELTPDDLDAASAVLERVTAYDRRTTGHTDDIIWAQAMNSKGITLSEAIDAVSNHFTNSTAWFMPGHMVEFVQERHRRRLHDAGPPSFPAGLGGDDPGDQQRAEKAYRAVYQTEVKAGASKLDADRAASFALRVTAPLALEVADPEGQKRMAEIRDKLAHFWSMDRDSKPVAPDITDRRNEARSAAIVCAEAHEGDLTIRCMLGINETRMHLSAALDLIDRAVAVDWRLRAFNGFGLDVRLDGEPRRTLGVVRQEPAAACVEFGEAS